MNRFLILLYFLFFILNSFLVLGSSSLSAKEVEENEEEVIEITDPTIVKQKFITAVSEAQVSECRDFIENFDYLISSFNRDVFDGMISCFDLEGKTEDCWSIFESIQPSFDDVSRSTTTPLIMSIRRNKIEIFNALIKLESVRATIDNVDEFARTALMYAAKRGNFFAIRKILEVSTGSVNKKDFMDKTALHYACEMIPMDGYESISNVQTALTGEVDANAANKRTIFTTLMANGAKIDYHGPEFKLNSSDGPLKEFIEAQGGKVVVVNRFEDYIDRAFVGLIATQLVRSFNLTPKLLNFFLSITFSNPAILLLNEFCFQIQKILLPGVDLNVVVSFDLGNEFKDISLNLLFLMILIPAMADFIKNYNKPNYFKF